MECGWVSNHRLINREVEDPTTKIWAIDSRRNLKDDEIIEWAALSLTLLSDFK